MTKWACALAWVLGTFSPAADSPAFPLRVSADRGHLVDSKGVPFFILGDTPWFLQKLRLDDVRHVLDDRIEKGFNTLFLEILDDSAMPSRDAYGNVAFAPATDITHPLDAYWRYADTVLEEATQRGFFVIMSDLWYGAGDGLWMHHVTPESARAYGLFLGARYARFKNLMWMHCGDRNPDARLAECARQLALAIKERAPEHLHTAHLAHESASSAFFAGETWLDVNMAYTYGAAYLHVAPEYARNDPVRPVILGETGYEDEPNSIEFLPDAKNGDLWNPYRIRRNAYWAVLSGAVGYCGGTRLWRFEPNWRKVLQKTSVREAPFLLWLLRGRPWWRLVPDTRHVFVTAGYGTWQQADYVTAAFTVDRTLGLAYLPSARTVAVDLSRLRGELNACWLDPTSGAYREAAETKLAAEGTREFTPPGTNAAGQDDWVLVFEEATADPPRATSCGLPVWVTAPEEAVECFDSIELTVRDGAPPAGANPFTDAVVYAEFAREGEQPVRVDGFCDSIDGRLFRVRFMPSKPGKYRCQVVYRRERLAHGADYPVTVRAGTRPGPVRVDPAHPFHFIREGTAAHWFWNATTTYQLLAWDDAAIDAALERLAALGVNRIRVALCGRTKDGGRWNEPLVRPTREFKFKMEPWLAARPENREDPGYDVRRFNLEFFRKADRMLRRARERDIVVSLVFYVDGADKGVDPFGKAGMGGADEQRYYRYVVARFAAFPNVMWDVANEYRLFRDDAWAEKMGALVKACDPYDHLTSTHGHGDFRFRTSPWADFAMYQSWDEGGGYAYMLKNRRDQAAAGRPMPQVNEEYGYEDHYPTGWGGARTWPARNADSRRRLAWEMTMAGGYQTTGERANDGTGAGPDTGGGWVNGRGNEQMTMLLGYRHMVAFFTSIPWWELEPRDDLAGAGTLLLARQGTRYVAYVRTGGNAAFTLAAGAYRATRFNCRTGRSHALPDVEQKTDGPWESPVAPDAGDWALLLEVIVPRAGA